MRRILVFTAMVLAAVAVSAFRTDDASGRPQYKKQFDEVYKDSKIADVAKEAKCNVCHYGKTKKNRNDYGTALSKHLNKDVYNELKKDKEALNKKVTEALKAVLKDKSVKGETFGELIAGGKLPGTAPEE